MIVTFVPPTNEPLNTLVPSKVLNTEPLTIPLPSVICVEPLITPLGRDDNTCADEDIVPLGISVCEPLVNPNAVICAEPLIVPLGVEPPPPLDDIVMFPLPDVIVMFEPGNNEPLNTFVPSKVLTTEPLTTFVPSKVLNTEPLTTPVPSKVLNTEPLTTFVPSKVRRTLPLTTPVPSKVLNTEPLTIVLPFVIWVEPLTTPLGSCDVIEPLNTPVPSKVLNTEPLTNPLGIFCKFRFQSAPTPPPDIPFILESTDELKFVKVEPLIIPIGKLVTTLPLNTPVPSKVLNTEPLTIPLPSVIWTEEDTNPLGTFVNSVKSDVPPPPPDGRVILFPLEIVSVCPDIDKVWLSVWLVK